MSSVEQQSVSQSPPCAHHKHSVQLYGGDERLLAVNVAKYVATGLRQGEGVLVIASPEHTSAILNQIGLSGGGAVQAVEENRLILLDARSTLDLMTKDGQLDTALFQETIGGAVARLRGMPGAGRRAYGEMVGVLWERGDIAAAIRLEDIWNEFLTSAGLELYCAYPINVFEAEFQSTAVQKIIATHTHLIPTGEDGDLQRAIDRAMADFGGEHKRPPANSPLSAAVPEAEQTILDLNRGMPEHAGEILIRARRYYEAEKRFRALIENSADVILVENSRGEIEYASPSTARVLGYAPDGVTGRKAIDLLHPDDRARVKQAAAEAEANAFHASSFDARIVRNDGEYIWAEGSVTNLSDEPAVGGIVWNYRDITERKAAEDALRESERRLAARERHLQTLLDSMPDCVKVLDRNGGVLQMNRAGLDMLEADTAEQVIGKSVYPAIAEGDRARFQALNESVFDGGNGGSLEFTIRGLKGAQRIFETRVAPLYEGRDTVVGALSATRDITDRKAAEAALRQANESLQQFAYAAAHDLQEPIRNVILYTELLSKRYGGQLDGLAHEFMSVTVEGARRMQTLIEDLLAYTRSLDRPEHEQPLTDANEAFRDVVANLHTAIDSSGAEVLCEPLPQLPAYRAHVVQLLQNLTSNALKYRDGRRPHVELSSVERAGDVTIRVRDNGIGVPADQRERIFGVFKRLHGRDVPGNGIGLAICHRIVTHYGGRIWVESNEGAGSTFAFTLPRRAVS